MYPMLSIPVVALSAALATAQAIPRTLSFQGRLTQQNGSNVNQTVPIVFRLHSAVAGGSVLWTETHAAVAVNRGVFRVELGSVTSF